MQSKKNFRAVLPWFVVGGVAACTGSVDNPGNPAPGPSSTAGSGSVTAGASPGGSAGSAPTMPDLPLWSGNVGSWCGPGDDATVWLVARPQTGACQAASSKVHNPSTEDVTEGLTVKLDATQLMTFPAQLTLPGRFCAAGAVSCADVQVVLNIESYTQGQGAKGSWAFTPPGQLELKGRLEASWCNWDEFLPAHPDGERLARDIQIKEVAVYQGVKVPIVRDMMAVSDRNADLVQQREAMLRVFVQPGPAFQSRELSARVTLQDGTEAPRRFEETITVSGASTDAKGDSTFNIALPKDAFKETTQYSVELRETSKCTPLMGTPVGARFPESGLAPVSARATGPVKVLLVPVRYDADGSGRLPDTSQEQLDQMRKRLYAMYPTNQVTLTVREPVGTNATDIEEMLDQMRQLRESDDAPSDLAYYGMVRQAETFREYCERSCTTGIAAFGSQNGTSTAGMGIGYLGQQTTGTFTHELGHIYRRAHSPCGGASGVDANYPYPEAALGSWGYDLNSRELYDPAETVDLMSYCSPDWISDYTYQALIEQIVVVNRRAAMKRERSPGAASVYRTLLVSASGQTRWGLELRPRFDPPGDPLSVSILDGGGSVLTRVTAFQQELGDGGRAIFVPAAKAGWDSVSAPGAVVTRYSSTTRHRPFTR